MYRDLLKTKYTIHGRNKEEGFDCYGLVIETLRRNNLFLPDVFYSSEKEYGMVYNEIVLSDYVEKIKSIEKNCLICLFVYGEPNHVGMCIGEGLFIHATKNKGVIIEPISRYKSRIQGVFKVKNHII